MTDLVSTVWVMDEAGSTPVSFGPGDDVPDWAAKQMGDHCFVDGVRPEQGASETAINWAKSTVAELEDEIESRNAERSEDDQIVPAEPGNKPQLVEALVADDAAVATEA